jgi:hypothetical protein
MSSLRFTWSESSKRYRDGRTGRFIPASRIDQLRREFITEQHRIVRNLAASLADGGMTLAGWETAMMERVKLMHAAEFQLGRGGKNFLSSADRQAVGRVVRTQQTYLRGFSADIQAGRLSRAQIENRAVLYANAASQSYERGKARAFGITLPAYPADGKTACKSSCRCSWKLTEKTDRVHATWQLSSGESCADCVDNAGKWNPYIVPV